MARNKTETITKQYQNNSKVPTTVSLVVEQVVVDNQLVPDIRSINPGVIILPIA